MDGQKKMHKRQKKKMKEKHLMAVTVSGIHASMTMCLLMK
jgi:hypothetical protein